MNIGNFTTTDHGYKGTIHTLCITREISIEAVDKLGENRPDYKVICGNTDLGAAWKKTSQKGNAYLSIELDDPTFAAPIYARLHKNGATRGYVLVWNRRRDEDGE
jgi:uncharacterized protein (DUF736 family)